MRRLLVLPAVGALIAWSVAAASAVTTHVPPGTGTLQAAIDAAAPGDTLVAAGVYKGPVVIDKRLKIVVDKHDPLGGIHIDAECAAAVGLTISADKVKTKGGIGVFGATTTGVVVDGTTRSKFDIVSAVDTCETATTGMVVRHTSRTSFRGGNVFYFNDTGIRIEDLAAKAQVKLRGYEVLPSPIGFAITNVADGAGRKGAGLSIRVLVGYGVVNGIVLTNADGVVVEKSNLTLGVTGTSVTIDAASANNLFRSNSMGGPVSDAGIDTCWKGNLGYADSCP
jgi:hypothetical protein